MKEQETELNFPENYYTIIPIYLGNYIFKTSHKHNGLDEVNYATFNYFETKAQAQAILDLKDDIIKYSAPEIGSNYWFLSGDEDKWQFCECFGTYYTDMQDKLAGFILPMTTTEEQRQHRITLLKKADEVYKELLNN